MQARCKPYRWAALIVRIVLFLVWLVFRQSMFQYRLGLVTAVASTAAGRGSYWLHDAGSAGAVRLARDITPGLIELHLVQQSAAEEAPAAEAASGRS